MKYAGRVSIAAGAIIGFGMMAGAAVAAETANINVSAEVQASCEISAGSLVFGIYTATAAGAKEGTADITVTCSSGTNYHVTLNDGANDDAGLRQMVSTLSSGELQYDLYSDSERTEEWNATNYPADTEATGQAETLTVYGSIPTGQTVPVAADYADTVIATVVYGEPG